MATLDGGNIDFLLSNIDDPSIGGLSSLLDFDLSNYQVCVYTWLINIIRLDMGKYYAIIG